jgi:hypothetical protein
VSHLCCCCCWCCCCCCCCCYCCCCLSERSSFRADHHWRSWWQVHVLSLHQRSVRASVACRVCAFMPSHLNIPHIHTCGC